MIHEVDETSVRFENLINELREWFENRCTPPEAISIMGALTSEMIWNIATNNRAAEIEAADFCARITCHVHRLNEIEPDATSTRTQ